MIKHNEFLKNIFSEIAEDEYVCVSRATPKKDGDGVWFNNYTTDARQWRKWDADQQDQAWYFCVSTVDGELNDKGTMVGRGRKNLRQYYCLVLDDIGTKAAEPPVRPSWILESSDGNFQWGYMLDPGSDWGRYEALVEYCHTKGWGDKGAGGSYRLMRVPGSANAKPGRDNFHSVITDWQMDIWSLEELAEDLGCDFSTVQVKDHDVMLKQGGYVAMEGIDPMLTWLSDTGHVSKDSGAGFVDVICPWADVHTSGANTAGYSPLGRGNGKYVQTRAFKCPHDHCIDKKLGDFVQWAVGEGGPAVSGYDPLPWLQSKYTYVATGQMLYDLHQRPIGGVWSWSLADWTKKYPGRVRTAGRENPVGVATAFIEDDDTTKCVDVMYKPVTRETDTGIVEAYGQDYVNTYVPPNWLETDETPEVFLEHMAYLIPSDFERENFLNWLAYKIQHPTSRSYAVVMVAEDAYGTGRSWAKDIIAKTIQGGVNTATLSQLIGKGTSAEQTYNDWKVGCQFICVEESKDAGLSRDDFYHGYETFKLNVDTKVEENLRVNEKYGRTRHEHAYYNVMIFSNHADALALPENDRRVYCVENPTKRLDYAYYDRLSGALQTQEPRRLYWWLMRRDVSGYDHIYPPMTPAKQRMIEDTRAPSDVIDKLILEKHAPDLVTRVSLKTAIIVAARELDDDKNMREPGLMTKILWKKLKSLRPEASNNNGARYMLDGKQTEVRAIRNQKNWVGVDVMRDVSIIVKELEKTKMPSNVVDLDERRGE